MFVKKKLVNLFLLIPNNIFITIIDHNIIIKGPFGSIKKQFFFDINTKNTFINSINISYKKNFNIFIIKVYKKQYNLYKQYYNMYLNNIKKCFFIISKGFLTMLQIWGIGYKILKKNCETYLYIGYNHLVLFENKKKIYTRPFEGQYIFLTSLLKEDLILSSMQLKDLKKKDIYKGKGIRFYNEEITLKIGKKE